MSSRSAGSPPPSSRAMTVPLASKNRSERPLKTSGTLTRRTGFPASCSSCCISSGTPHTATSTARCPATFETWSRSSRRPCASADSSSSSLPSRHEPTCDSASSCQSRTSPPRTFGGVGTHGDGRPATPCLLALFACRRAPAGPDPNYEQASKLYQQLYASELDDAYGDPQMDRVVAFLKKVDSSSADADAARAMLGAIQNGREVLAK